MDTKLHVNFEYILLFLLHSPPKALPSSASVMIQQCGLACYLLVLLLHPLAQGLGEALHNGAHHAEVGHVVDVRVLGRRGDGLQLILICILDAFTQETWQVKTHLTPVLYGTESQCSATATCLDQT